VEFTVQVSERDGRSIVAGSGELDVHVAPALQAEVDPLAKRPNGALIIDLTDVGFIDSTGLGVLVTALKHAREAGGTLDVVASTPRVLKVFALTGLDVVIPMHATLDEALSPN
jgi:anti-sigma B factor antagonist